MDISDDGKRFVAEISGGDLSYNADLPEIAMGERDMVAMQNALSGSTNLMSKRSGVPYAIGGTDLTVVGANPTDFWFFPGTKRDKSAGTEVDNSVYYVGEVDGSLNSNIYAMYDESTAGIKVRDSISNTGRCSAFLADRVMFGTGTGGLVELAGTVHAEYSTGTATFTTGSTTVNLSSNLTGDQADQFIGSWIRNTGDSASTRVNYRIIAASNGPGSTVTLDRAYNGSNNGSGKNFIINAAETVHMDTGITDSTGAAVHVPTAVALLGVWGRLAFVDSLYDEATTIRWTGVVGSSEGTAPRTGIYAVNDDGFLQLSGDAGKIRSIKTYGDAVLVFQDNALTVLYGAPVFDGTGSLDASTKFTYASPITRYANYTQDIGIETPYGFFFLDRRTGLNLFDGRPTPISSNRVNKYIANNSLELLAYVNDHIIIHTPLRADNDASSCLVYHIPSDSFSLIPKTAGFTPMRLQPGRGTIEDVGLGKESLVGLQGSYSNPGVDTSPKLWDFGYPFFGNQVTANSQEADGTDVDFVVESPAFGDTVALLRPTKVYITYRLTDEGANDPGLIVTLNTGLENSSYDSSHTWTSTASQLPETGDRFQTRMLYVETLERSPSIKVKVASSGVAQRLDIAKIVIVGDAEGSTEREL